MLAENKFSKYLLYAIGEIILVVIGILIALQVNNLNNEKAEKNREQKYLANIVLDLKKDIKSLNYLLEFRRNRIIGDQKIIAHMNGIPVDNLNELSKIVVNSMMERNFTPNNTTFSELSNSGNLNLISNDSIKFLLLELEELYKVNELSIEHETFDYREYISKSANRNIDVDLLIPIYMEMKTVEEQKITLESFNDLLSIREYKNGLYIMTFLSDSYIIAYENMKSKSENIIGMIENKK
jgi:hypothetical protein